MEIITNSPGETKRQAFEFARSLKGGEVVALYGDLGAGKTTFTQGLAEALGIKQRLVSPTFVLYKKYRLEQSPQNKADLQILNHIDCYRLGEPANLTAFDTEEIFNDPTAVTVIEWPERIGKLLPKEAIKIKFVALDENKRQITFL